MDSRGWRPEPRQLKTTNTRQSPRLQRAIEGVFAVLASGAFIDRPFIVRRFKEAGYAQHLAERHADQLIAANTDIQHFSRWSVWGTNGRETYSFNAY